MLNGVALEKAFTMMGIALPLMFLVIGVIIAGTVALRKVFPAPAGKAGRRDAEQGGGHE